MTTVAALHAEVARQQAQQMAALDTISREYDQRMAAALMHFSNRELIAQMEWSAELDQHVQDFAEAALDLAGDHPQDTEVYRCD